MQLQLLRPLYTCSPAHGLLGRLVSCIPCFTGLTEHGIFINLRNSFKNVEAAYLELSLPRLRLTQTWFIPFLLLLS